MLNRSLLIQSHNITTKSRMLDSLFLSCETEAGEMLIYISIAGRYLDKDFLGNTFYT
jgi:hypothetical protein